MVDNRPVVTIHPTNLEDAILGTFLLANSMGLINGKSSGVFDLNPSAFTTKFRKAVADKINNSDENEYDYLAVSIEDKVKGTKYEQDFINVIGQTPLTFKIAKKYHDRLVAENSLRALI